MNTKQTEIDALFLAKENGCVFAGFNHAPANIPLKDRSRLSRVHHSTINALIKKGKLKKKFSSDGGFCATLA